MIFLHMGIGHGLHYRLTMGPANQPLEGSDVQAHPGADRRVGARRQGVRDGDPTGADLRRQADASARRPQVRRAREARSEEHTSELQSLMRISYAVFCLKKKKKKQHTKSNK